MTTTSDSISTQELRFERLLEAPIATVWRWLAEPELRARWFMADDGDDLRTGGRIGFAFAHERLSDGDVPTPEQYRAHVGSTWSETVTRCEPPHVLAFEWDGGAAGEVTITLSEAGERTRLVLVHSGLRGRDDAINFGGGWRSHLAVLERRLRGEAVPDFWALHAEAEAHAEHALEQDATVGHR
jgi:uncharacterized protein YndB with AHSA1/START domain